MTSKHFKTFPFIAEKVSSAISSIELFSENYDMNLSTHFNAFNDYEIELCVCVCVGVCMLLLFKTMEMKCNGVQIKPILNTLFVKSALVCRRHAYSRTDNTQSQLP